ncbi:hypothetical protein [Legionella fairfieldensis]|uniref:hypothetical protein n=1 Tax=Legionella fairfieldensis TaxID=45064 RepID=UPI00048D9BB5|nr:hypothetical protein [Legionella fairfieldensis]
MFKTNYTNELLLVDDTPSFFSDHRIEPAEWPSSYNDYQSDNHSQQNVLSEAIDPDVEIKLEAEPPVINQTYLSPFGFFHFQPDINFSHDNRASQSQTAKILPAANLFFVTEEKHSFRKEKSNENSEKSLVSLELLEKKEKKNS